jgi:hypothetical protein
MIQMTRNKLVLGGQSALNILLAFWLVNEYIHNRFMQDYLASTFSTVNLVVPIGIITAAAIAGSSFTIYSRRQRNATETEPLNEVENLRESKEKLAILDTCPLCNLPLRSISVNRFQCRKCRRYFKK